MKLGEAIVFVEGLGYSVAKVEKEGSCSARHTRFTRISLGPLTCLS